MMIVKKRVIGGSLASTLGVGLVFYSGAMFAQEDNDAISRKQSEKEARIEEVVVTGSNITRSGYETSTPVTLRTGEELNEMAPSNLADALNQLPQFMGSQSPASVQRTTVNTGVSNGNYLNLRNLGPPYQRTLILLDGRRVPPTSFDGAVSVDTLPQMLVERVDVVTGGASAVYGSDAVAGVVNFILDTDFEGFRLNTQYGMSAEGDGDAPKLGVAFGKYIDRLHLMGSFEWSDSDGIERMDDRPLGKEGSSFCKVGSGSESSPFSVLSGCHATVFSYGGNVSSGPLAGMTFQPDGSVTPFNTGGEGGVGGEGSRLPTSQVLQVPLETKRAFFRADYDFNDTLSGFGQVSWAEATNTRYDHGAAVFIPGDLSQLTVFGDNAFLHPSASSLLNPTDSFVLSLWTDPEVAASQGGMENELPLPSTEQKNTNTVATFGLSGRFGDGWSWDASYTKGIAEFESSTIERNMLNVFAALDSVNDNGDIVCRVSLTSPELFPGCSPFNPFGVGSTSQAAIDYIIGEASWNTRTEMDFYKTTLSNSELFENWAGPVGVAFGVEYREETLERSSNSDPASIDPAIIAALRGLPPTVGRFATVNVGELDEVDVDVTEVYMETLVPLAHGLPGIDSLDFNAAYRFTDYSTSGEEETWKMGIDWSPIPDLRIRATVSSDIRAPSLFELNAPEGRSPRVVSDPHTGTSPTVTLITSGNTELKPEQGDTTTIGFVYQPQFFEGFGLSVDWYEIEISDGIINVDPIGALVACEQSGGAGPTCDLIDRPLPFSDRTPANAAQRIADSPINSASITVEGVDVELSYEFPANKLISGLEGKFEISSLVSHLKGYVTDFGTGLPGSIQQSAGYLGAARTGGRPEWRGSISAAYRGARWDAYLQTRFTGTYELSLYKDVQTGQDAQFWAGSSKAPNKTYTDLTLNYLVNPEIGGKVFLTVNNLFDEDAPLLNPAGNQTVNLWYPTIRTTYDVMGRYFTLGFKMEM